MQADDVLELTPDDFEPDNKQSYRNHHITMLTIMSAVVLLSFLLKVADGDRVSFRVLPERTLPHTCLSRSMWDFDCPGCGLTRSFIHLAEGNWRDAWNVHRVGWLLAGAVLVQFPYRISRLRRPPAPAPLWTKVFSWILIVALIGNWVLALFGL